LKKFWILFLWIGVSQSISVLPSAAFAKACFFQSDIEKKKIEFLLHEIQQLDGAKFWRNGTAYTPKEAVDYLRMKMKWNDKGPIRSAREFIEKVASKSTITGKPYFIVMADGTKLEAKVFLDQKLSEWKE
jgi:hypothetical protein